jgi:hypothetical protein
MPILKDIRQENFCQNVAIKAMTQAKAYLAAGFKANETSADQLAWRLKKRDHIKARIAELQMEGLNSVKQDHRGSIAALHDEATARLQQIMHGDNVYASLGACKEVLSRTVPIVKQSQSINIKIDSKEAERRQQLLAEKRRNNLISGTVEVKEV